MEVQVPDNLVSMRKKKKINNFERYEHSFEKVTVSLITSNSILSL
jgi:hypothetical protein